MEEIKHAPAVDAINLEPGFLGKLRKTLLRNPWLVEAAMALHDKEKDSAKACEVFVSYVLDQSAGMQCGMLEALAEEIPGCMDARSSKAAVARLLWLYLFKLMMEAEYLYDTGKRGQADTFASFAITGDGKPIPGTNMVIGIIE